MRLDLVARINDLGARLVRAASDGVRRRRQRLADLSRALPRHDTLLEGPRQRLDIAAERLPAALTRRTQHCRIALSNVSGSLRPSLLRRMLLARRDSLYQRAGRLRPRLLTRDIGQKRSALSALAQRLGATGRNHTQRLRVRIEAADRLRETLGYRATLARGYAVIHGPDGVLTSLATAASASTLEIEFSDGRLKVGRKPARKPGKPGDPGQGSLF